MRACAMWPPAAATMVVAPGDRTTTVPALSTDATDVSVLVQPDADAGQHAAVSRR